MSKLNPIHLAIENNEKIEDQLNVVIVISNPCLFKRRYHLAREFIKGMSLTTNVRLFICELAYGNQQFELTKPNTPGHIQLRSETPLWHKENMINIVVKNYLPSDWKAVAWIDADIEFESTTWVDDTLKLLNGSYDVLQLFSHAVDMDKNGHTMAHYTSFARNHSKDIPIKLTTNYDINYSHCGFAWACSRTSYDKMNGLLDQAILGSADHLMMIGFCNQWSSDFKSGYSDGYKQMVLDFQSKANKFRCGYVPGVIHHFWHGMKNKRYYVERETFLIDNKFDPSTMVTYDSSGLLTPTDLFPQQLKDDIMSYFQSRDEDE